jgi:hypothetical protein
MNRYLALVVVLLYVPLATSCSSRVPDVREQMLADARRQDPQFPDGKSLKLTRFAYIGTVTANGETLRVVEAGAVIPDMLAPRGQTWLYFFDTGNRLVGRQPVWNATPRWCEGSRVYFFGIESDGEHEGNALDVSEGLERCRYVIAPAPGSWMPDDDDVPRQTTAPAAQRTGASVQ